MRQVLVIILLTLICIIELNSQAKINDVHESIIHLERNAWVCYEMGKYDSAEYYYIEAIGQQEAIYGHFTESNASHYLNLGAVYRKLYHLKKSLEVLNIAENIYKNIQPNSIYLGYIYNNKANIYFNYADFYEAELYYRNALNHFIENNYTNNNYFDLVYLNLFNVLLASNRLDEAKHLINDILNLELSERRYSKHLFLAMAYEMLEEIDNSIYHYKEAEKALYSTKFVNTRNKLELNYRYASLLINSNQLDEALILLLDNLKNFNTFKSIDFHKLSETYLLIGRLHYLRKDYLNCYAWLGEAIRKLQEKLHNANLDDNFMTSRVLSSFFVDIKHLHAQTCIALYEETGSRKYLDEGLSLYSEIIDVLKVFKLHMKNESSKLRNTESRISIVHEAINLATQLYEITGESSYLDIAFHNAENTKSFVLLSEIKSNEAMQFADLPSDILAKESRISNEIAGYEEMIYNEKTSGNADSMLLVNLNRTFFLLKDDYNNLLDSIERNYPRYFELKYNPNFITPKEAQGKLRRNECLVEYVLSDSILTTFVIDKQNINVLTSKIEQDFSEKCFDYFNLLQNQDFSKNVRETYKEYVTLGKFFYDVLVAPVLAITDSREITFVPDGAIMYLPFESFITADVDKEYINYRDLPYLIYDLSVGYSHSSTLLFSERIRTKSPHAKVLAFAPEYENLLDSDMPLVWNRQSNPDFLMPLPGAKREVEFIARTVPSDVFTDYEATESNFKKYASDYDVLHLAMHTIMDDENPMFSKLAFARNWSDTTQDHNLFTYEIYNLKLNASMVVLSSCSSGYGKMQKGEGMMSMARGFIYAGCPAIVMTLWQVADNSSADLMSGFYKHLKTGKSKKKALREAKIDYITSSDKLKANPYFWSAFLMVGNSSPLYRASAGFYMAIIITGFSLLVIFITYKKQVRKALKRKR
jgi:CHAT domain-containing protein